MDRIKELFATLWMKFVAALKSFEDSSLFERIMRKYESLTPGRQHLVKLLFTASVYICAALIVLGPAFMLLSKAYKLKTLERLEMDALSFQADYEARTRGYATPAGWKPFSSNSANEIVSNFNEYLLSNGVPEELGVASANDDTIQLSLRDISIRQARTILFQLEALYPKVKSESLDVHVDPASPDRVEMNATFQFNPAFANQFAEAAGPGDAMPSEESFEDIPPPTSGGTNARNPRYPSNPVPVNPGENPTGDFNSGTGDYIPPPPPPSGDYEEFTPPDIPDDIPPPPPPPGFEDE